MSSALEIALFGAGLILGSLLVLLAQAAWRSYRRRRYRAAARRMRRALMDPIDNRRRRAR
jgi:hypothetical protein